MYCSIKILLYVTKKAKQKMKNFEKSKIEVFSETLRYSKFAKILINLNMFYIQFKKM